MAKKKKPESESASVCDVDGTNFVDVNLVITNGKMIALLNALEKSGAMSPVARDLWVMLNRADQKRKGKQ